MVMVSHIIAEFHVLVRGYLQMLFEKKVLQLLYGAVVYVMRNVYEYLQTHQKF